MLFKTSTFTFLLAAGLLVNALPYADDVQLEARGKLVKPCNPKHQNCGDGIISVKKPAGWTIRRRAFEDEDMLEARGKLVKPCNPKLQNCGDKIISVKKPAGWTIRRRDFDNEEMLEARGKLVKPCNPQHQNCGDKIISVKKPTGWTIRRREIDDADFDMETRSFEDEEQLEARGKLVKPCNPKLQNCGDKIISVKKPAGWTIRRREIDNAEFDMETRSFEEEEQLEARGKLVKPCNPKLQNCGDKIISVKKPAGWTMRRREIDDAEVDMETRSFYEEEQLEARGKLVKPCNPKLQNCGDKIISVKKPAGWTIRRREIEDAEFDMETRSFEEEEQLEARGKLVKPCNPQHQNCGDKIISVKKPAGWTI